MVSPPASLRDSQQKDLDGGGADVGARTHLQRWLDSCIADVKGVEERDINVDGARKKKSAFTVNVVEHCAFCGLKSFSVLPQPAGGNLSNHFGQLQSSCSIWNLLF